MLRTQNLTHIRSSASTSRVLNLVHAWMTNKDDPEFVRQPVFRHRLLNQSIIIKHTPREHEQPFFEFFCTNATKIIFPMDISELQLGGRSIFFEEEGAKGRLRRFLNYEETSEEWAQDLEILQVLSEMVSFDPYLLREHFHQIGRDVSRAYFTISDADLARISALTRHELYRLVKLAFGDSRQVTALTGKLNEKFLNRESDDALIPLTQAIGLPPGKHHETMFSWKGFLYYKWRLKDLLQRLPKVVAQLGSLKVQDANANERRELEEHLAEISNAIDHTLQGVQTALNRYDFSFESMVSNGKPKTFQRFLNEAPQAFEEVGTALSRLVHICSFWEFRFPDKSSMRINYDEASAILEDFAGQLSCYTMALEDSAPPPKRIAAG